MQKFILLLILLFSLTLSSLAQKDINAWKNEKNIEQQFQVFKKNLNYWNGNYFLNENQLNDYYRAFSDSVDVLEKKNIDRGATINDLQNQLNSINDQLSETKSDLETSIKNRNSIEMLGININKGVYTLLMSVIIIALVVILVVLYYMYTRSKKVTVRAMKDFDELKKEFEIHKKDALERYTKINMELHHTRLQQKKKL